MFSSGAKAVVAAVAETAERNRRRPKTDIKLSRAGFQEDQLQKFMVKIQRASTKDGW